MDVHPLRVTLGALPTCRRALDLRWVGALTGLGDASATLKNVETQTPEVGQWGKEQERKGGSRLAIAAGFPRLRSTWPRVRGRGVML